MVCVKLTRSSFIILQSRHHFSRCTNGFRLPKKISGFRTPICNKQGGIRTWVDDVSPEAIRDSVSGLKDGRGRITTLDNIFIIVEC